VCGRAAAPTAAEARSLAASGGAWLLVMAPTSGGVEARVAEDPFGASAGEVALFVPLDALRRPRTWPEPPPAQDCDGGEIGTVTVEDAAAPPGSEFAEQRHALVFTDGQVAVTVYECCYFMWCVHDGSPDGGSIQGPTERLSASSREACREIAAAARLARGVAP